MNVCDCTGITGTHVSVCVMQSVGCICVFYLSVCAVVLEQSSFMFHHDRVWIKFVGQGCRSKFVVTCVKNSRRKTFFDAKSLAWNTLNQSSGFRAASHAVLQAAWSHIIFKIHFCH